MIRFSQFSSFAGQNFLIINGDAVPDLLAYFHDCEEFELVYALYSFARNKRSG